MLNPEPTQTLREEESCDTRVYYECLSVVEPKDQDAPLQQAEGASWQHCEVTWKAGSRRPQPRQRLDRASQGCLAEVATLVAALSPDWKQRAEALYAGA